MEETFKFGAHLVRRIGYGAMQLAGPGVMGSPSDPEAARIILREAVALGVDHIDTSDFYGPHVTNLLIREALSPYPHDLLLVTKIRAKRGRDGSWKPALSRADLSKAVEDNRRNLGLDVLEIVNLRMTGTKHGPVKGSIAEPLSVLIDLQRQGLVRNIGISNVTYEQVKEARGLCDIACVQNHYNLAHRGDDALINELAAAGIAYVPYFPLGGFQPLQFEALSRTAQILDASPSQVALAWLLHRSPNVLVIPGTGSLAHLRENLAAQHLIIPEQQLAELNAIATVRPEDDPGAI
ncbi:oxidoreductase [Paracoccus xiamenensis]|uniref:oxidoreductase n=1 Tax=Paracoccus xiamenensis TaxID=2714901 RepID=UPI00140BE33C|nr:oxidoreductase [Paracoccus xiamenensis]NHF72591.1 oxidoreductase [Paracoccus xiamenensis]